METKLAMKIYMSVVDLMKLFMKKEIDNLYADVLTESLGYFTQEYLATSVIPQALEFSSVEENLTTRRIAVHLLGQLSKVIQDTTVYVQKILPRAMTFYHDLNYDLRRIICCYSHKIVQLLKSHLELHPGDKDLEAHRLNILRYVCDLIEDDECTVKTSALH